MRDFLRYIGGVLLVAAALAFCGLGIYHAYEQDQFDKAAIEKCKHTPNCVVIEVPSNGDDDWNTNPANPANPASPLNPVNQ